MTDQAKAPTENEVRNACVEYLIYDGWLVLRINSGAATVKDEKGKRRWFWFAKWFALGEEPQTAGISDLLCLKALRPPLVVEAKIPGNEPTEAQRRFMAQWEAHGGKAVVAYGVDDIQKALSE